MPERTCTRCGRTKPTSEFYRAKDKSSGYRSHCKECFRAYRAANTERQSDYYREWLEHNRDRRAAYQREHAAQNPHFDWVRHYVERALRYGHEPVVEDFTKDDVIARYGDSCFYCEDGSFEETDHYVPVIAGGPHTLDNIRPSCSSCNSKKNRKIPEGETAL